MFLIVERNWPILLSPGDDAVEENVEQSSLDFSGKTELHITEETDDDVGGHTPNTHNMEDLFTKIHRYANKHTFIWKPVKNCI